MHVTLLVLIIKGVYLGFIVPGRGPKLFLILMGFEL